MTPNMIGAYGPWFAENVLTDAPGRLSLRTGNFTDLNRWRTVAQARVCECIAPVNLGGVPQTKVEWTGELDGVQIEKLSWQLPCGPRTEAVFLKPVNAKGPLPAVLGLHDHGGNKFLGWRKIAQTGHDDWKIQLDHFGPSYEGVAWANQLAKQGFAVLVHDTFPFASRRVRVSDVPQSIQAGAYDPEPTDAEGVAKYNQFAREHESTMEKSLMSAGTTWPGVYVVEDMRALDVLCARPEVDATRIGCAGLSGGGMRSVFLGGLDERIRCAIAVGFTTTWRDFLLYKSHTHTWMTYVPHLPQDLDFPEILGLRVPLATMVMNCWADPLYTPEEMKRTDEMLRDVFKRAGAPDQYSGLFYEGGHKFDLKMQDDAFAFFKKHLIATAR